MLGKPPAAFGGVRRLLTTIAPTRYITQSALKTAGAAQYGFEGVLIAAAHRPAAKAMVRNRDRQQCNHEKERISACVE